MPDLVADGPARRPLPRRRRYRDPRLAVLIALVSTAVVFGGIVWAVVHAPNWPLVQADFLSPYWFADAWPSLIKGFWTNVRLFMVCEALVLVLALVLAVLRSLPGPVFFPIRLLVIVYVDVFRAVPGILVIYILGFGVPGLQIPGVSSDRFLWATVALTLLYSAYVSEVYRAGIESIHPSQEAAARSLGMSRLQALRYVVVPQAVRRVIPPLLNDFIGLQKDTVLVSFLGVVEIFRASTIKQSAHYNYTPYLAAALVFLILVLPLARLTDWLVARDRARGANR